MKVSREQVRENRANIVAAALTLFKERGFDAVTLADVMGKAGLTHGGFYGHFRSKDDLVAQTCAHATDPGERAKPVFDAYRTSYLSERHREDVGAGCIYAALGGEVVRQTPQARHALTEGLKTFIDALALTAPGEDEAARRIAALNGFSAMVGGIMLARLVDDPALSDELLGANRTALGETRTTG
jgi:TetR/AcrR family transcriptional repressor of nem operon